MGAELVAGSDQRIGFIGQTRMGKSFLAEKLLAHQPRVIALDSKGMLRWHGYHLTNNPIAALLTDRIIYRPDGGKPPDDWYSAAVASLHERGGGVLYVDELSFLTSANRISKGLADAFRLGGELGVGVWYSAQESTTIHNTTLRQSEQLYLFYNQGNSDREKMAQIVGDMAFTTAHFEPYEFTTFKRGETTDRMDVPVYVANA